MPDRERTDIVPLGDRTSQKRERTIVRPFDAEQTEMPPDRA
jgi:hypothetical protein